MKHGTVRLALLLLFVLTATSNAYAKLVPCPTTCNPPVGVVQSTSPLPLYNQPVKFLREVKMGGNPMWEWAKTVNGPACTPKQLAERSDKVACAAKIGQVMLVTVRVRDMPAAKTAAAVSDSRTVREPKHCPLRMPDSWYTEEQRAQCAAYDAAMGVVRGPSSE